MEYKKEFYEYLNGDSPTMGYEIPRMSGPNIISFGKLITDFPLDYNWGGVNFSRWEYMKKLIDYIEKHHDISIFFYNFFIKKIVQNNSEKAAQNAFFIDINSKLLGYGQKLIIKDKKLIVEKVQVETILDNIELEPIENKSKEIIGEGGMAEILTTATKGIYKKQIRNRSARTKKDIERFYNEFLLMKLIGDGDHVLKVYDYDESEVSYTMDQADGSFNDFKQNMNEEEIIQYFIKFAKCIQYLQKNMIVHRDIKPANTLRVNARWLISDFGISKGIDSPQLTTTGNIIGTENYVAPELIENPELWKEKYENKFDVYAFGHSISVNINLFKTQEVINNLTKLVEKIKSYEINIDQAIDELKNIFVSMK